MKVGHDVPKVTSISVSNAEAIVVRGEFLTRDLIGEISFTDHVWLMVTGRRPSDAQRKALDACLVAVAEHGLSPSVQAARMTLAAAPEAFQGAIAAGVLGAGSVVLGTASLTAEFFSEIAATAQDGISGEQLRTHISSYLKRNRHLPGYGHPLHKEYDGRALKLLQIGRDAGLAGIHMEIATRVEDLLPEVTGKPLRMNASAAIASLLLDAGYPLSGVKGVPILGRVAGLIAHLVEEQQNPLGFTLYDIAAQSIEYVGPLPEGFVGTHR